MECSEFRENTATTTRPTIIFANLWMKNIINISALDTQLGEYYETYSSFQIN